MPCVMCIYCTVHDGLFWNCFASMGLVSLKQGWLHPITIDEERRKSKKDKN